MAPPLIPPPPPISAYYQHNHPPVTWHDRNANCRIFVQYAKGKQFTIGHGLGRQIPGPIQLQKPSSASPLKFPSVRSLNPRRLHRLAGRIQRQRSHNSVIGSSMWGFILQPMTTVQSTGANGAKGRRKTALPARVTPKQKLKSIPTVLELARFVSSFVTLIGLDWLTTFIHYFFLFTGVCPHLRRRSPFRLDVSQDVFTRRGCCLQSDAIGPTTVSPAWRRPMITSKGWSRTGRKCKFFLGWWPACRPIDPDLVSCFVAQVEASDRLHSHIPRSQSGYDGAF